LICFQNLIRVGSWFLSISQLDLVNFLFLLFFNDFLCFILASSRGGLDEATRHDFDMVLLCLACSLASRLLSLRLWWLQVLVEQGIFDALFVPALQRVSLVLVTIKPHGLPVSVVPANFVACWFVLTAFLHQHSHLLDWLETLGFVENIADVGVLLKACVKELEHVRAQGFQVGLTRVLLVEIQILHHKVIHVVGLTGVEEGGVLENALTGHDAVAACQL